MNICILLIFRNFIYIFNIYMEFNTNNIISYIESQKSYQVFNIDYTQKEINCIKNFNIENFG